jgi:hypothetical protein
MDSARTLLIPSMACDAAGGMGRFCVRRSDLYAISDMCLRNRQSEVFAKLVVYAVHAIAGR